jgi:hypothetical protein
LPETHAAYERWCEITKLDESSAQWVKVWDVLDEAGLVECDRCPQRSLFDDPGVSLGATPGARRLQLALLAGAYLSTRTSHDLPTATALAATWSQLAPDADTDIDESALTLADELAERVLHIANRPGMALSWVLANDLDDDPYNWLDLSARRPTTQALAEIMTGYHDDLALAVFARLAQGEHEYEITEMTDGNWVITYVACSQ